MPEIYKTDKSEKEVYDKEYIRHVEARKKRAQILRDQQIRKNRQFCLIAGSIVVFLILIICISSCSKKDSNSNAEVTTPVETTVPLVTEVEETTLATMYTTDVLNLRAQPNTISKIIIKIGAGKKVEIISEDGKWCQVKRGKDEGYVMKKYLSYTNTLN